MAGASAVWIAREGVEPGEKFGRHRWALKRTLAWLDGFRRSTVRYERDADLHLAFADLGCTLICFDFLRHVFCKALLRVHGNAPGLGGGRDIVLVRTDPPRGCPG